MTSGPAGSPTPAVCLLDPYGDIAAHLAITGRGRHDPSWSCFHTNMWATRLDGVDIGVVTMAMGAPWAVLAAERLAGSGCRVLLSVAPALPVDPPAALPCVVLIDRALRGEVLSAGRLPASRWSHLDQHITDRLAGALDHLAVPVSRGTSWSTAAPHRVRARALARASTDYGRISCVETDAAALYASSATRALTTVCFAHLDEPTETPGMEVTWGPGVGAEALLAVVAAAAQALTRPSEGPVRA